MRLIVDTNVLFTFFWKDSVFRRLLNNLDLSLISPLLAVEELDKYSGDILKKAKISRSEFNIIKQELLEVVDFIPWNEYSLSIKSAKSIARNLSEHDFNEFLKDIDFFALALKFDLPIWSEDKLFKKQSKVEVFNTEEIIKLFDTSINQL